MAGEAAGAVQQEQSSQNGGQSPPESSPGQTSLHRSEGAAEAIPVACRRQRSNNGTAIVRVIEVIYSTKPRPAHGPGLPASHRVKRIRPSSTVILRTSRAGTPPTIVWLSTSAVTTELGSTTQ